MFKRLAVGLSLLLVPVGVFAASQADLLSEISAQFATNSTGQITAARLRTVLTDVVNTLAGFDGIHVNAVPDSTGFAVGTDNRTAFQAALTAAASTCQNVIIPAGSYRLSGSLTLDLSGLASSDGCRPSIIGSGSGIVTLYFDNGVYSPLTITGSASFLDLNLTVKGFKIRKADSNGVCLNIANAAYIRIEDIQAQGCTYGFIGTGILNSLVEKSRFLFNTYGIVWQSPVSHPNAMTLVSSVVGNNLENGIYLQNPTTFKMIGGSVEANGFQGGTDGTTTYRGGVFIDGAPIEGGTGASFESVYFEQNAGAADIAINTSGGSATGQPATYSVKDSTFNRINNTHFTVNNIVAVGTVPAIIRYEGNHFFNSGYTANAARQHVSFSTAMLPQNGGNWYDDYATEGVSAAPYEPTIGWIPYTVTVGCISGSLTTASALGYYKIYGKSVTTRIRLTISAVGTCTYPTVTLPVLPLADDAMFGRENSATGKSTVGQITAGSLVVRVSNYDDTQPAVGGSAIVNLKTTYESQ